MAEKKPAKKPAKRDSGEGSVYPATKKKIVDGEEVTVHYFRGYVTLGFEGGKQKRKYFSAATKSGANAKLRKLLNERDAGTLSHTASPTLEAWIAHFLAELAPVKTSKRNKKGLASSTISAYKAWARNWVNPRIGKVKLESLKAEHLEQVYKAMAAAGLSDSSISTCHTMLMSSLDIAWKRGHIPRNVALLAMPASGTAPAEIREVADGEMRSVLAQAAKRRMPARWVLRLAFGLRQGECLGLAWDDIDLETGVMWIRRQLQRDRAEHGCGEQTGTKKSSVRVHHGCGRSAGKTTVGSHGEALTKPRSTYPCGQRQASGCPDKVTTGGVKDIPIFPCGKAQPATCPQAIGGGLRLVPVKTRASQAPLPMAPPIVALLKARRAEQRKERIQEGPRWKGWESNGARVDLVFTYPGGTPLSPQEDWAEWHDLLSVAGVEPIPPHRARHWAATALTAQESPRVAMEMLRHSDVGTTMNFYAQAPSADLRRAAEALAETLLGEASGE